MSELYIKIAITFLMLKFYKKYCPSTRKKIAVKSDMAENMNMLESLRFHG